MPSNYMWDLLYNNSIINITTLYDICSIYSESCKNELIIMYKELFSCKKLYIDDLKNSVQFTIKVSFTKLLNLFIFSNIPIIFMFVLYTLLVFKPVPR